MKIEGIRSYDRVTGLKQMPIQHAQPVSFTQNDKNNKPAKTKKYLFAGIGAVLIATGTFIYLKRGKIKKVGGVKQPDVKGVNTNPGVAPNPEVKPNPGVNSNPDVTPKPEVKPNPGVNPNPDVAPKPEVKPGSEVKSVPGTKEKPNTDAKPVKGKDVNPDQNPEISLKPANLNANNDNNNIVPETKKIKINVIEEKPEFSPEALDKRLSQVIPRERLWSFDDMRDYYGHDCRRILVTNGTKFIEGPVERDGSRLFKAISKDGSVTDKLLQENGSFTQVRKNSKGIVVFDEINNGKPHHDGGVIYQKLYTDEGTLLAINSFDKTGDTRTRFFGDIKTSMHANPDGSHVFKVYVSDEKGKAKCIRKEFSKIEDNGSYTLKTVEYTDDGKYSKTTTIKGEKPYWENDSVTTIIRDRKGNIVKEENISVPKSDGANPPENPPKLLASWYKDYLTLCKKYGVSPRPCGVAGGAGDHYFELCLRRSDPVAYDRYLNLQEYRARYDEKAQLMEFMRYDWQNKFDTNEFMNLSVDERAMVLKYIKDGKINFKDLPGCNAEELKTMVHELQQEEFSQKESKRASQMRQNRTKEKQRIMVLA